jgi:aspartyl protease family protein
VSAEDSVRLISALGMLALVGSALTARRLSFSRIGRGLLSWLIIFAVVVGVFSYRDGLGGVVQGLVAEGVGLGSSVKGGALRVPLGADGHYWVLAEVNGTPVRFLIDSGASLTAVSRETAERAELRESGVAMPAIVATANGTVMASQVRIERLVVGPIVANGLSAVTAAEFGEMNVLGMNFLSSLEGWGVEKGVLVLRPERPDFT